MRPSGFFYKVHYFSRMHWVENHFFWRPDRCSSQKEAETLWGSTGPKDWSEYQDKDSAVIFFTLKIYSFILTLNSDDYPEPEIVYSKCESEIWESFCRWTKVVVIIWTKRVNRMISVIRTSKKPSRSTRKRRKHSRERRGGQIWRYWCLRFC